MSTQHIDEADELADRVCIMSHGKVIALGTPMNIKKKFGVGYIISVEPKANHNMSPSQVISRLKETERIFLLRDNCYGITKSIDSTFGKTLYNVPTSMSGVIGTLMHEVEQEFKDLQIDIELNSLEDAFIKIAEDDFNKQVEEDENLHRDRKIMTPAEEKAAFDDYKAYTGEQSSLKKIGVIYLNRMKMF